MWECTIHKKDIYVGVQNSITKIASWHGAQKFEEQKRKKMSPQKKQHHHEELQNETVRKGTS